MKFFSIAFLLLAASAASTYFFWYKPKFSHKQGSNVFTLKKNNDLDHEAALVRVKQKAIFLKAYLDRKNYNSTYCFLIDMKLRSGKNRFFVYNLEADSVVISGLVTHGSGKANSNIGLSFSNIPNSNCTSLGKYKIRKPYTGRFGLAYKLYGLDKSNSKAFERFVVLHAHSCVPNEEIAPYPICKSQGCPTVAPAFLTQLKRYLEGSELPILLWIYY